jgi:hypothetical protein
MGNPILRRKMRIYLIGFKRKKMPNFLRVVIRRRLRSSPNNKNKMKLNKRVMELSSFRGILTIQDRYSS